MSKFEQSSKGQSGSTGLGCGRNWVDLWISWRHAGTQRLADVWRSYRGPQFHTSHGRAPRDPPDIITNLSMLKGGPLQILLSINSSILAYILIHSMGGIKGHKLTTRCFQLSTIFSKPGTVLSSGALQSTLASITVEADTLISRLGGPRPELPRTNVAGRAPCQ